MWFYYMLFAIGTAQAGKSKIKIAGTGTIENGKTAININVQIDGPGGLGIGPQPGAGAGTTVPTQAPTTGQPIGTTQASTTGQPIGTTQASTAGQPIGTTQAPTTGQPIGTTQAPTTGQPIGTTQAPTTGQPIGTTQASTTGQPIGTTQAPTTGQPIGTTQAPTTQAPTTQGTIPPTGATTPEAGGGLSFALQTQKAAGYGFRDAFSEEEKSGLAVHNNFRQVHQSPPMTLNRQMCDEAQAYAEKLAKMGSLMHSPKTDRPRQRENLSFGCSRNAAQTMEQAVTNWYNEVCSPGYDFTNSARRASRGTGHFTQVVWKGSTILGIGRAESTKGRLKCAYIVARYKPAGNKRGLFPENVKKGSFDPNYCNTIKKKKRYFDISGKKLIIGTPLTQVDVPDIPGKDSSFLIELLKKKKSFVRSKHH